MCVYTDSQYSETCKRENGILHLQPEHRHHATSKDGYFVNKATLTVSSGKTDVTDIELKGPRLKFSKQLSRQRDHDRFNSVSLVYKIVSEHLAKLFDFIFYR